MAIDYKSIGLRIKRYRMDSNLSQEELGDVAATNSHHISNIEMGRKYPSLDLLIELANALKVSADDLLTDSLEYTCHYKEQSGDNQVDLFFAKQRG